jgi:hypothetical protein
MSKGRELYEDWRQCPPKEADFNDVKTAAIDCLGAENVRDRSGGSHLLVIDGPVTRLACQVREHGYGDLAWLRETLSISTKCGKKVKSVYIGQLLKLIAFNDEVEKSKKP